ncbi:circadian clock protein KaiC [Pseudanabaena sp. FACHB-2040]|uniref:circadian clock protein KaiC n=1 Tax=Pseudanabaena sp. FACHB-2040 TaxID=2692859 RepID=UPI001682CE4B|nr:circadian clock protein KaiC [Pseudanabaena sp. FACHB-2040]MBD2258525.1 circadian clock protein KaiC [Pseudanabaena sp. FACHB-2040]
MKRQLTKCPTGIRGLDEITYGGLPQGRPTLICGRAGCGKTLMAMEFLVRGAEANEPGVFISLEESTDELAQNVASLGWDVDTLVAKKLLALDYIHIERTQIEETGDYDLEALFVRIGYAIDRIQAKRVVIDTLETLFGNLSNTALVRSELRRLFLWLKAKGVTAIITAESGDHSLTRHGIEEFVSDCVMVLDQRIQQDLSTRRLHIAKYRGSQHSSNEYPFLIESNGIVVLPLTSVELNYTVSSERISTGVKRLDGMLGGKGIYRGSSVLISGTSGTGKSSLSGHFAAASCSRGERCLYVAFEESANQIIRNMRSIGLDLETPQQSGLLKFHALRPTFYGLEMHLVKICQLVQDFEPKMVIFDPISSLTSAGLFHHIQSFLMRLVDFLKAQGISIVLTNLTTDGTPLESTDVGISSLMDTWLLLRDQETNGERNRLLFVLKSRGTHHSNQVREFRMTSQGIEMLDVYLGPDGIVTGTARLVKEAQAAAEAVARQQAIERKQHEIERKRLIMEAQIHALQAEFEAEKDDIDRLVEQAQQHESQLLQEQRSRAKYRYAEDTLNPKNYTS